MALVACVGLAAIGTAERKQTVSTLGLRDFDAHSRAAQLYAEGAGQVTNERVQIEASASQLGACPEVHEAVMLFSGQMCPDAES